MPGGGKSDPNAEKNIEAFINGAVVADGLMKGSVNHLFMVVASSEKIKEVEAAKAAANGIKDPQEKNAKLAEIEKSQEATIAAACESKEADAKVKKLDAKKKEALGNSIYNFTLAMLLDRELAAKGPDVLKSASGSVSRTRCTDRNCGPPARTSRTPRRPPGP